MFLKIYIFMDHQFPIPFLWLWRSKENCFLEKPYFDLGAFLGFRHGKKNAFLSLLIFPFVTQGILKFCLTHHYASNRWGPVFLKLAAQQQMYHPPILRLNLTEAWMSLPMDSVNFQIWHFQRQIIISRVRPLTSRCPLEKVSRVFLSCLCGIESLHYSKGNLSTWTEDDLGYRQNQREGDR